MSESQSIHYYLERLHCIARDLGLTELAKDLRERQIPALQSDEVHVVFLGEFNRGKSSLINAVLGESCLETGIVPCTKFVTSLHFNASQSYTEWAQAAHAQPRQRSSTEQKALSQEQEPSRGAYLRMHLEPGDLPQNLVMVDTPGLNDFSALEPGLSNKVLQSADVLVFVLDGLQALSQSEWQFLQSVYPSIAKKPLFFVINKVDVLSTQDLAQVRAFVEDKIRAHFGSVPIYALSARKPEDYEFAAFKAALIECTQTVRRQEDAATLCLRQNVGVLSWYAQILSECATHDAKEIRARLGRLLTQEQTSRQSIETLTQKTQGILAWSRHEIEHFSSEFSSAIEREIDKVSARDVEKYLGDFITEEFSLFAQEHSKRIEHMLQSMTRAVLVDFASLYVDKLWVTEEGSVVSEFAHPLFTQARQRRDNSLWLLGSASVSAYVLFNALSAGVIAVSLPIFSLFIGKKMEAQALARAKHLAKENICTMGENLWVRAKQSIEGYSANLHSFIDESGAMFYTQLREALETLLDMLHSASPLPDYAAVRQELEDMSAL